MDAICFAWPDSRLSPNGTRNARLRARLTKIERQRAAETAHRHGVSPVDPVRVVAINAHPPSARWDDDNARAITKVIRDGIADAMGSDDRHFRPDYPIGAPVRGGAIVVEVERNPG